MVTARSAAMAFNRLADRDLDRANPRTQKRELVTGKVPVVEAWALFGLSAAAFVLSAGQLNRTCLLLAPVALAIVCAYSLTKRFTVLSHFILGLCLAIAPVGAWLALSAPLTAMPLCLALAVLFWVAGFDILYACQDRAFDQAAGLRSIPARFGIGAALRVSSAAHVLAWLCLLAVGVLGGLGIWYFLGVILVGAVLIYEHCIISPSDLSRLNLAFFTLNGVIGVVYFGFTLVDFWR
jgi:4-hydroxybenzoate polyprenyltransferase